MASLIEIDGFLRRTGMAPTTFGRRAANDPRLIGDLRIGRVVGTRLTSRIDAYMAAAK